MKQEVEETNVAKLVEKRTSELQVHYNMKGFSVPLYWGICVVPLHQFGGTVQCI